MTNLNSQTTPHYWQEWVAGSGVDPDIVATSVEYLSGDQALQALLYAAIPDEGHSRIYVTRTAANLFGKYEFATDGGWWVSGVDPLNDWKRMEWGQFKPDHPRPDPGKPGKFIKYETPPKAETRALLLFVPDHIAEPIYQRYDLQPALEERKIGFWYIVWKYGLPIIITEGAKKAGSLISQGYAAIALSGITMGVRTKNADGQSCVPHLIPDLAHFATPEREVYICFDYETKTKTIQAVEREIEKLKVQFVKARSKVKIVDLPGPQKGVDDFIAAQGAEAFHQCYDNAITFEQWQTQRYSRLTQPADLELDQRYLGSLPIPANEKLILLKSPKGTGKTESFVDIAHDASQQGIRVLLLTHRVQLGQAICDRIGLPYVTELKTSEEGSLLGYGVCIDSLYPESQARFNAENWHDAIVIIDEVEQFIWHLLEATTEVSNRRMPILAQLKQLLINVLESDRGRIILSDADLSDLSLEFIWGLIEQRYKPFTVINDYEPDSPWQINHYSDRNPERLVSALSQHIEAGGRPFILTQSQQAKSRWSTTTLEGWLNRHHPDKRVLRIDSQTVADPTHAAYLCTGKLNEILKDYDVVIASPVIETGVSIDIRGHITSVWGIFNGVTPENSVRQALARVREAVPRHVWVARYGPNRVANGSTSVRAILRAEYEVAKISSKLIQVFNFDEEMVSAYSSALKTWAKMAARINAGMVSYRESVLAGLRAEGHLINEVGPEITTSLEVVEAVQSTRAEQHQTQCEAIAVAEDLTPNQYEELKGKKAKTPEQRQQERKHAIRQRYQIDVTPELVAKDDDGWYPKLRLFYFLSIGNQFLKERDRQSLENIAQTSGSWLPTLNRSQYSVKVAVLEALGIKRLLDPDLEFAGGIKREGYSGAHPYLLDLQEKALKYSQVIKNVLGISISDKFSPVQIAQALLGKLGIKLHCLGQSGGAGHRERIYQYIPPKDGRDEILNGWYTRDDATRTNSEMHTPGIDNKYPAERRAS